MVPRAIILLAVLFSSHAFAAFRDPIVAKSSIVAKASIVTRASFVESVSGIGDLGLASAQKGNLQTLLDANGSIRLRPNTDYKTGGLAKLTLSSNQKIVGGGYNTRVPPIEIASGADNVYIEGVWVNSSQNWSSPDVTLLGGEQNDITIIGGTYAAGGHNLKVKIASGAQVNRLKTYHIGGLLVDHGASGYVRDSVFSFIDAYWLGASTGQGSVSWTGNATTPARGNVFLNLILLGPKYAATFTDAGDLYFISANTENNNSDGAGDTRGFIIDGSTKVWLLGTGGGPATQQAASGAVWNLKDTISAVWFGDRSASGDLDDDNEIIFDNVATTAIQQHKSSTTTSYTNDPVGQVKAIASSPYASFAEATIDGSNVSGGVTAAQKNALMAAYLGTEKTTSPTKPTERTISDMLGASWATGIESKFDSSGTIQACVDANNICVLEQGIYYIGTPIKIGASGVVQGIVGPPEGTYLVAKGSNAIIQGRGDLAGGVSRQIVLQGLTLYGGTKGIYFSNDSGNLGAGGQISYSHFQDLRFLKQTEAGADFKNIYGVDNNTWLRVTFYNMPIAIQGDNNANSGDGMNYMDKQHFIDAQAIDISDTFWSWDSSRASGENVFEDSYFENIPKLAYMGSTVDTIWSNNTFKDITGAIAVDFDSQGGTRSALYQFFVDNKWQGTGPTVVYDTMVSNIGVVSLDEEFAQTGGTLVAAAGTQTLHCINSRITGSATAGGIDHGTLANCNLGGAYNKRLAYCYSDACTSIDGDTASPYRQVLAR